MENCQKKILQIGAGKTYNYRKKQRKIAANCKTTRHETISNMSR